MKNKEIQPTNKEILSNYIINKFNGALLLKKSEAAIILNRSVASLDRDRSEAKPPNYIKTAEGNVYYSVTSLVEHILDSEVKMSFNGYYNE